MGLDMGISEHLSRFQEAIACCHMPDMRVIPSRSPVAAEQILDASMQ